MQNKLLKNCQKLSKKSQYLDLEPRLNGDQSTYDQIFYICNNNLIRSCYQKIRHDNFKKITKISSKTSMILQKWLQDRVLGLIVSENDKCCLKEISRSPAKNQIYRFCGFSQLCSTRRILKLMLVS